MSKINYTVIREQKKIDKIFEEIIENLQSELKINFMAIEQMVLIVADDPKNPMSVTINRLKKKMQEELET